MLELFTDYTLRTVLLGAILLGVVSGSLGVFAVLRRQALLGDAISHAALPGIALAYLVTGEKGSLALTVGAALAGFAATLLVLAIVRTTRVKDDASLGLVLSVFFGVGLVLLTWLQSRPDAAQAGLDTYLFGQAAALVERDLVVMALLRRRRAPRRAPVLEGAQAALLRPRLRCDARPAHAGARGARHGSPRGGDRDRVAARRRRPHERDGRGAGGRGQAVDRLAGGDDARGGGHRRGRGCRRRARLGPGGADADGARRSCSRSRCSSCSRSCSHHTVGSCGRASQSDGVAPGSGSKPSWKGSTSSGAPTGTRHTPHPAAVVGLTAGASPERSLHELERRGWAMQVDGQGWVLTDEGRERARHRRGET